MTSMIKKVAKAIQTIEYDEKRDGNFFEFMAKVAILAMKEPTKEMLTHIPYQSIEPPIDTYQRIINAALEK